LEEDSEVSILLNKFNTGYSFTGDSESDDTQQTQVMIRDDVDPLGIKDTIFTYILYKNYKKIDKLQINIYMNNIKKFLFYIVNSVIEFKEKRHYHM